MMAPTEPTSYERTAELVERCLANDRAAWSELVSGHRRLIYSIPVKLGLKPDQADDVFQDVCVKLLSRLETLRDGRSLVRWLMVTTQRRCYDLLRQQGRIAEEAEAEEPTEAAGEEAVLEAERAHLVRMALERLKDECRQLITSLFFRDPPPSYKQLSEELGRPAGSLGPTRQRCLKALHGELIELGFQ